MIYIDAQILLCSLYSSAPKVGSTACHNLSLAGRPTPEALFSNKHKLLYKLALHIA